MNVKELAEQAALSREFSVSGLWLADDEELERFAQLVRADEREACAALCDEWFAATAGQAIRDRGNK